MIYRMQCVCVVYVFVFATKSIYVFCVCWNINHFSFYKFLIIFQSCTKSFQPEEEVVGGLREVVDEVEGGEEGGAGVEEIWW